MGDRCVVGATRRDAAPSGDEGKRLEGRSPSGIRLAGLPWQRPV